MVPRRASLVCRASSAGRGMTVVCATIRFMFAVPLRPKTQSWVGTLAQDPAAGDRAAAVDREEHAGDELALAAREVDHRPRDVVGLAEACEVHPFQLGAALGRHAGVPAL